MADLPVYKRLYDQPYTFDFFQAVRLLGRLPDAIARARPDDPFPEPARFRAHLSLNFPPSALYSLDRPATAMARPLMTVTFLGLYGPSGVLPHHYTWQLLELEKDRHKKPELGALRDWYDLFNHRFTALFYRAWEKYRFFLAHERGLLDFGTDHDRGPRVDPFTRTLYSFVGLGTGSLRDRMRVVAPAMATEPERTLARVEDLGVLRYAGLFAQRHRTPWGLGAVIGGYFGLPLEVRQFQGQWLPLEPANQTRMPMAGLSLDDANCRLGVTAVAGDRVWDIQGKITLRLGPMNYAQFLNFLPDTTPVPERKAYFLLCHLARLYLGAEFDFAVQLVLKPEDVPACQLTSDLATGPRLGWNCWVLTEQPREPADEAVFDSLEITLLGDDAPGVDGS